MCHKTLSLTTDKEIADFRSTDAPRTPRCDEVERLLTQVEAIAKEKEIERQKKENKTEQRKRERRQTEMLHDLTKGKATRGLDPEITGGKRAHPRKLPDTPAEGAALFLATGFMDKLEDFQAAARNAEDEESRARREDAKLQAQFTANMNSMMTGMMAIHRELALSIKEVLTSIKDKLPPAAGPTDN